MPDRIVLLGTGTCQLQTQRMASSILVEVDGLRLVYDFGRGVAHRLVGLGLEQDDVEHVVLSHFHPDHLCDLIPYLHAATWSRIDPRTKDLHIYGPIGLEVQLMRLLSLFGPDTLSPSGDQGGETLSPSGDQGGETLSPSGDQGGETLSPSGDQTLGGKRFAVHLHETRGEQLVVGGREFGWSDLPPADNHGLALTHGERTYAFTGDSSFHPQEVAFLDGVDLAVIDAGHLEDEEIFELAARTRVPRIVCSHLYRELDETRLNEGAHALGFAGRLIVGQDLMTFEL